MGWSLEEQMMHKRERERDRYQKFAFVTFLIGAFFGSMAVLSLGVSPIRSTERELELAVADSERSYDQCREELDFCRHEAPESGGLDWTRCMWALTGCTNERDVLYEDIERYQNMTGWVYERDPDHRFLMYGWEHFEPAQ